MEDDLELGRSIVRNVDKTRYHTRSGFLLVSWISGMQSSREWKNVSTESKIFHSKVFLWVVVDDGSFVRSLDSIAYCK